MSRGYKVSQERRADRLSLILFSRIYVRSRNTTLTTTIKQLTNDFLKTKIVHRNGSIIRKHFTLVGIQAGIIIIKVYRSSLFLVYGRRMRPRQVEELPRCCCYISIVKSDTRLPDGNIQKKREKKYINKIREGQEAINHKRKSILLPIHEFKRILYFCICVYCYSAVHT